ncbi:MAG: ABC transporter substrate-binding protein [Chloroflexota bacterium]
MGKTTPGQSMGWQDAAGPRRGPATRASRLLSRAGAAALLALLAATLLPAGFAAARVARAACTLTVVNYKDYGSDQPWAVQAFEKMTGCRVVHQYITSDPQGYTLVKTSGAGHFDVYLPPHQFVPDGVHDNLFLPIDTRKLRSYRDLYPNLRDYRDLAVGGKVYGVPWVWGTTSIGYNTQKLPGVTSISVLWDKRYARHMLFYDDYITAIMTAALALGQNAQHPSNLAAIKAKLLEQKRLDRTFWTSQDDWQKGFGSRQIWVGNIWSGSAGIFIGNGDPMRYVVPREGAPAWISVWSIIRGTRHYDLALKWINYMTSVEFLARYAATPGGASPAPANSKVKRLLSHKVIVQTGLDETVLPRAVFFPHLTAAQQKQWSQLWEEVKAGG